MYAIIDDVTYRSIRNLSFNPEVDLSGDTMPAGELSLTIRTDDRIAEGRYIALYDDADNLWAQWWITWAATVMRGTVELRAQSPLVLLDNVKLGAEMYSTYPLATAAEEMFHGLGDDYTIGINYAIDGAFDGATLTGFCPAQTARERLQWICLVIGAYIQDWMTDTLTLKTVHGEALTVPFEDHYWRPRIETRDIVTALRVTSFTFEAGEPGTTDEWVTDGTTTWIVTRQDITLKNPDAPDLIPPNEVSIDDVMLVNGDNASDILTRLAPYWFTPRRVSLEAIDNGRYLPGQKLNVYADAGTMLSGYAEKCQFAFGKQAKAAIELTGVADVEAAELKVIYTWEAEGLELARREYLFPAGYEYSIQATYIDQTIGGHRYILRPEVDEITGTMPGTSATETVRCVPALDLELSTGILTIISVDSITEEAETDADGNNINVGVIA